MDGVKMAFGNNGIMVEAVQQCAKNRKDGELRCICNIEVQVSSIWAKGCMFDDSVCVLFDRHGYPSLVEGESHGVLF